jgi:glycine cleavage system H protein
MNVPSDLFYTRDHSWVRVEGNKAYVGITDFAQNALGDVVYVDLPNIGDEFSLGDTMGTIESVKAVSDLYMPLSGAIIDTNLELEDNPGFVNEDPYKNWFVIIGINDETELDELLRNIDYKALLS